jgi:hypothetical protein
MSKFTDHIKQVIKSDIRLFFEPFVAVIRALRRGAQLVRSGNRILVVKVKERLSRHKTKDDQ